MKTKAILIAVLAGFIGSFFGMMFFFAVYFQSDNAASEHSQILDYSSYNKSQNNVNATPVVFGLNESLPSTDFTLAADLGIPAVVHVKTQFNQPNYTVYDFIFGTQPRYSTPVMSSGSGVIISADGYIVTNNHVIENAEIIEVVLNNKKAYTAKLVGRDATTDIALLKIEAENLPFMAYGDSDNIRIGEWVLAIGNPFNLTSTATAGIISAKARNINIMSDNMAIESFIQTDAAVNPGNSGGALVNTSGELIGINTAIASRSGSFVGYSFAIPVNIVRKIVADLIEFGEVQRAYLGLDIIDIDDQIAKKLEIEEIEGVYVAGVWQNGAGEKAGVLVGDIIMAINSTPINSNSELLEQVSRFRPGDNISILLKRGIVPKKYTITLQNKYGEVGLVKSQSIESLGARFEPVSDYDKNRLRLKCGLQVTDVTAGKFALNGIQKSFIIVRVNNSYISTVDELKAAIETSDGGLYIEGVYPNGTTAYYAFKL